MNHGLKPKGEPDPPLLAPARCEGKCKAPPEHRPGYRIHLAMEDGGMAVMEAEAINGEAHEIVDPRDAAETAGLTYVSDEEPGITRRKAGSGWSYRGPDGKTITDKAEIARIRKLAVPPAYTEVWICARADGHIQATGRDAKGRKQYRYHPAFREVRDSVKYEHVMSFAQTLPHIRASVKAHMALRGLPREKVLATIVHLLETTLIRVGNEDYVKQNKSYGLTTLREPHVKVNGANCASSSRARATRSGA